MTLPVPPNESAREWAEELHLGTNHRYDDHPYTYHLEMVVAVAGRYLHCIPESDRPAVLAACWLHDAIEDCRVTYNNVKERFGQQVAELVYALTNEKGRNRAERANDRYYAGIRATKHATFVKLCDRIANASYSLSQPRMLELYRREQESFIAHLAPGPELAEMLAELEAVLGRDERSAQ
jgi:(p)ppGpp synthase/HD superfamily hydrolase